MSRATDHLPEPLQVVARLVSAFDGLGIEYLVGG